MLGSISVNLSFLLYMFMLAPQLVLNIRRQALHGLSWGMHLLLLVSAICDACYAIDRGMPWQYYSVSFILISILGFQHAQYVRYHRDSLPLLYRPVTIALGMFVVVAGGLLASHTVRWLFPIFGYVSMVGYLVASVPQIITNRRLRSTEGVALSFVLLQTGGLCCDAISAYSLNWGLPNKIGAPASLSLQAMLLTQFVLYRRGDGKSGS